jgi:exonuclease SbcD
MGTKSKASTTPPVRLLHTSDWHIGRRLDLVDLLDQQAEFGEWLVDVVRTEAIDGVLIAGDLFDRAVPSGEAVQVLDEILVRLLALGVTVVAITGNHDSAERLHFGSHAMAVAGLHVRAERPSITDIGEPVVVTSRHGGAVEVLALPYLEPHRLRDTKGADRRHDAVLEAVVAARVGQLTDPSRSVVMAHAFVAGGQSSTSERELSVGNSSAVSPGIFRDFGYAALGHLHRPQAMSGGHVVYSGSPLPYSFSEEHTKSVRILECGSTITSSELTIDVGRPVRTLRGTLDGLLRRPEFGDAADAYVRAELTDEGLQVGAMDRLRDRFPHILQVDQTGARRQASASFDAATGASDRTPIDVVDTYLIETFTDLDDADRSLVVAALEATLRSAA